MAAFNGIADFLNGYMWGMPLVVICLLAGLLYTILLRGAQIRHIPTMVKLLLKGEDSAEGLSSFQAFSLALAGRVGTGNIAGVATAVCFGGPGAMFWMWMVAILGSATTFIECSIAQLYKEELDGQYRGGAAYYITKIFNNKALGAVFAAIFLFTLAFTQIIIHTNTIAAAVKTGLKVPEWGTGIVLAILLALIIFGGVKRIGAVAEKVVPFMAGIYIIVALVVIFLNVDKLGYAFNVIITSAFGKNQIIGAALGSAMIWGTKRAVFSSETGQATATQAAASAEVSHPAKQGLVQSFSIYIDTLFVCTATGLMLVITNSYNVIDANGKVLVNNLGEVDAGAPWVQMALGTEFSWSAIFIAFAMFFFGFTTILNNYYSSETNLAYLFRNRVQPKSANFILRVFVIACAFLGTVMTASDAWNWSDTCLGIVVWINMITLFFAAKTAMALLRDFERQKKMGLDPIFDPEKINIPHTELWIKIRDKYRTRFIEEGKPVEE